MKKMNLKTDVIRAMMTMCCVFSFVALSAQTTVNGTVIDELSEPVIGATVTVVGTTNGTATNIDGQFTLKNVKRGDKIKVTYVGYSPYEQAWAGQNPMKIQLSVNTQQVQEVVVTAMGIMRKEKSLTYATQMLKADDLMMVEDPNLVNSLEGKIAGMSLTPSAGGAGGATKILLRGNKSILGNNTPLIVVDGIPMSNSVSGQKGVNDGDITYANESEGSDPLSEINPDDIDNIQVLKGANAAALYGSRAANGVVMITTKKGKEGKIGISVNSNITFDNPLVTPKIQNIYGADVNMQTFEIGSDSWGRKISSWTQEEMAQVNQAKPYLHLRNYGNDDVSDFFKTGVTTNNSVALTGGTSIIKNYFSFANSHANGMVPENSYNRNTIAFRQSYNLWKDRLKIETSINYVQTKTENRPGGGTVLNPLYTLYVAPRNVDMGWYKDNYVQQGEWTGVGYSHYQLNEQGSYDWTSTDVTLHGPHQNWWAYETARQNNPYWLTKQNKSVTRNDRIYGYVSGRLHIWDGLNFQARISVDHTKTTGDYRRYATTMNVAAMEYYGTYGQDILKTDEIYTDYLLSYDKTIKDDWSVSATAGWVGHTVKGTTQKLWQNATETDGRLILTPTDESINYFSPAISNHGTSYSNSSNWDKAFLMTGQVGWKEMVYVEGSWRQDWYRAFKQFSYLGADDNYGYFAFGGNAILSKLLRLPEVVNYAKYRLSYSEVGNSIPNILYSSVTSSTLTNSTSVSNYVINDPRPEKTKSFETGLDLAFFNNKLTLDLTYYNSVLGNAYIETGSTGGKTIVTNSAKIRNSGIELTIGYNHMFSPDFTWRTTLNYSYNTNKILETYTNPITGQSEDIEKKIARGKVSVIYKKGGEYGDMYARDFQRNADGTIYVDDEDGSVYLSKDLTYIGNMNAKTQLGWGNTLTYKGISLYFMISGKIGGKVISFTEAYLDYTGNSQRTADARLAAEQSGLTWTSADGVTYPAMVLPDGKTIAPVEAYYKSIGGDVNATQYIYNATNFRLKELSLGYTFKNLFGEDKHLALSFVARNLFFLYKDAPFDPDVALSTQNSMNAFECFNMPSSRSFGFNVKLNF